MCYIILLTVKRHIKIRIVLNAFKKTLFIIFESLTTIIYMTIRVCHVLL